jgi:hypothetical protein
MLDSFEVLADRLEDPGKICGGRFLRCVAQGMRV